MRKLELSIERQDVIIRAWFKKHVKWLKSVICYINAGDCVMQDSGEVATRLFVIAEPYDKKNPFITYETYWVDDQIVGHCKSNLSAIPDSFNINHVVIPQCNMSRMIKLIYGLLLAHCVSVKITANNKQITF